MLDLITRWIRRAEMVAARPANRLEGLQLQVGRLQSGLLAGEGAATLRDAEFRVFSQFGEDGIIQYLIQRVPIEESVFVEFGVESYRESNTRFLLQNDNWRGLILDIGSAHRRFLRRRELDWRHHIDARTSFINRDNIDSLLAAADTRGDIGLLSIDIDGNDLWVLEAIEAVSPRILVVEYNSMFGAGPQVTIPYQEDFRRTLAHPSHLYWGASLAALNSVAKQKGYVLVGGNSAGNNAFWVREDVADGVQAVDPEEAWALARFRESRGPSGELTYVGDERERLRLIREMPLWILDERRTTSVAEIYGV